MAALKELVGKTASELAGMIDMGYATPVQVATHLAGKTTLRLPSKILLGMLEAGRESDMADGLDVELQSRRKSGAESKARRNGIEMAAKAAEAGDPVAQDVMGKLTAFLAAGGA